MSALMLVLMPEHRLICPISKKSSPDAYIDRELYVVARIEKLRCKLNRFDAALLIKCIPVFMVNLRQDSTGTLSVRPTYKCLVRKNHAGPDNAIEKGKPNAAPSRQPLQVVDIVVVSVQTDTLRVST